MWARIKLPWLRHFLSLDYGIASPDTRVFRSSGSAFSCRPQINRQLQ
jgi:hypothetical protein